ncbi:MAG: CDP-glucose 4,6-dehydratase [Bacteroidales bacterium]|nr:CDP-glucose 4,6-dehydratase [Bacteroidales bacterium]
MESMVDFRTLFDGIYQGKKVLVTGHTGFKGSWLVYWLKQMGATVFGYSLSADTQPAHFNLFGADISECIADIRNQETLLEYFTKVQPDIVFHLAAQPLVRLSYADPVGTYSTNVMGTLHVLEACRHTASVKAIVIVSSDKCYDNREWEWGYRENDPMGGYDPYSSSKGCTELLTASYRNSFFNNADFGSKHQVLVASGRAGNVIGGGDWAADRLIPDMVKAAAVNNSVFIRNPLATRPWQHVLEPLSGYLMLGWRLLERRVEFAQGWNFGPAPESNLAVKDIVTLARNSWSDISIEYSTSPADAHEANLLMLDCSRANKLLHWKPIWDIHATVEHTIAWYRTFYKENSLLTNADLNNYISDAKRKDAIWTR